MIWLLLLQLVVWAMTVGFAVYVFEQEMQAQRDVWAAAVGEKRTPEIHPEPVGHVSGPRLVKARLLDADEKVIEHQLNIPADQRRPGLRVDGVRYQAVRLASDGVWEYRRTA